MALNAEELEAARERLSGGGDLPIDDEQSVRAEAAVRVEAAARAREAADAAFERRVEARRAARERQIADAAARSVRSEARKAGKQKA